MVEQIPQQHMQCEVCRSFKAQTKSPTKVNIDEFKKRKKVNKKECEKAKLKSWRDLQSGIKNNEDMNAFRKIIQGTNQILFGSLCKANGELTNPGYGCQKSESTTKS